MGERRFESRESTRCWGTTGGVAVVVATRARWRVDSDSSVSKTMLAPEMDGDGVMGNTGADGTRTGKVVVVLLLDDGGVDSFDEEVVDSAEEEGVGRPWAARTFMTASHPFSRDLIRSLSSAFSRSRAFSRSCSCARLMSACWRSDKVIPARSCLFSSSSSATRRSRAVN